MIYPDSISQGKKVDLFVCSSSHYFCDTVFDSVESIELILKLNQIIIIFY